MTSKARTMLILACIFITITLLLLAYDAYICFSAYSVLFGSHPESFGEALGAALGGILLYVVTIMFSIGVILGAILTLPFDIILLKINGKQWYSITILALAITAIVMAIFFVAMLPVISNIRDATQATSSSSIESTEVLLLI